MKSLHKLLNLSDSPDKPQQRDNNITDSQVAQTQNTLEKHELNIQNALNINVDFYLYLMKNKIFPAK